MGEVLAEPVLLDLIGAAYDAALEPARLPELMRRICEAFGAVAGGIQVRRTAPVVQASQVWVGLPPEFESAYLAHWFREDPWAPGAMRVPALTPYLGQDLIPARALERTGFYQELCRPHGFADLAGGTLAREGDQMVAALGLFRGAGQPAFDEADRAALAQIVPHLARMVQILRRLRAAGAELDARSMVLDALPSGVIGLDDAGRIAWASAAATRMLAGADGLSIAADGTMRAATHAETAILRSVIEGALRIADGATPGGVAGALAVRRPSGRRAYDLRLVPVRASADAHIAVGASVRLIALLIDPEDMREPPADTLRRLFGLTPAEAALAQRIAQGLTPKEAAAETGVSWNTTRYQLRQVFAKTGTERQAELVRLLAGVGLIDAPAPAREPPRSPPSPTPPPSPPRAA